MPQIISKPGRRYKFRNMEFWAERGLIHMFDFRNNALEPDYTKITVRDMLLRARAINDSIGRVKFADERNELHTLVENMIAACKDAKRQGRPDDPKTFEHIRNMRDKRVLHADTPRETSDDINGCKEDGLDLPPIDVLPGKSETVIDTNLINLEQPKDTP